MVLYRFEGKEPKIGEGTYVSQSAEVIGDVTIGKQCYIRDYAIIGMGAIVSDYAVVGVWSVVAEGCVVKNKQVIKDEKIVAGVPAKIVGEVPKEYQKLWTSYKNMLAELALKYPEKLKIVKAKGEQQI
jgi:carbonic anhydrase/acetyltransferase-like protein (isoleucine patch superfamily)